MPVYPATDEQSNGNTPSGNLLYDPEMNATLNANGNEQLSKFEPSFWQNNGEAIEIIIAFFAFILLVLALIRLIKKIKNKKIDFSLNTSFKRAGFVTFIIGLCLMLIGTLNHEFYFDSETFFLSIQFSRRFGSVPAFGIGFYLTVAGLFASFLFDYTLGPLFQWVKQSHKKA
ncbi:hypothetical protein HZM48_000998 [Salmonella enterica]|nr:hypothetical protein [Salmonella enterica]EFR2353981.1 hypothetical protein [Salmonella enterica]EFR5021064.1 hypothetical protein [Salmonella enterica]EHA6758476.1 hypothetical protein [Salmonella enterica]EHO6687781.1 hypothetical protein [Salmonella enterica]